MTVSTHVLDTVAGRPAPGVAVALWFLDPAGGPDGETGAGPGAWVAVEDGATDADGRHRFGFETPPGVYRVVFGSGEYFLALGVTAFFPEVTITFTVADGHYHVPLLLAPFAYSTYRGS